MRDRIFHDAEVLAEIVADRRSGGESVVLANGCFDIIHVGHIRYLEEASERGGILVVAVNDDDSTLRLKGEGRPVMKAVERAEILAAMRAVDYVLIFGEDTVDGVLRALTPDVHAKGTDYTVETVPEIETAREIGCETVITGDRKERSSREIISRLRREK
jgi:rfaE bifunctional protein nucleotidyltransferase chain/domain